MGAAFLRNLSGILSGGYHIVGYHVRRLVRRGRAATGLAIVGAMLAACTSIVPEHNPPGTPDVFDKIRTVDLQPRFPWQADSNTRPPEGARPATYLGTVAPSVNGAQPAPTGEGYELNFENTPVTTVAKTILGDILGVTYTIDPRVQGTVTLASGRPLPKSDLLFILENALRMINVSLVRDGRGYRVIPAAEAIGNGSVDSNTGHPEAGYGITVIPIRHVSAQTLIKLFDSFAVKPGAVRVDASRNLLVIQGSSAERRNAVETVMTFDVDWMRGQSVGVYPVQNSTPETLIGELEKIMDSGEGGLSQNLVKLQPIARLNAILVVAGKPDMLRTVGTWINRLDKADASMTGVKVYRVRYGEARQIAALLNDMFVGHSGNGLDSAVNQLAPGAGMSLQSSIDRSVPNQPGLRIAGAQSQTSGSPADSRTGGADSTAPGNLGAGRAGSGARQQSALSGAASTGSTGGIGGPAILPGVRISADAVNNTLLIYANQESYRIIERTLRQLDRPQLQVAIDATIAEITLNENLSYGVQVFLKSSDLRLGQNKGSIVITPSTAANATTGALIGRVLPGFNFLGGTEATPRVILDALHDITEVKVLSTPSVVVLDNQVATLQVGDQVPVTTGTATVLTGTTPVVNSIDYRNTGVILRVAPRINVNGNVLLDIEQEISNVNANADTLTPTVAQRKVKSTIAVASGQTVLLAGLISERQNNSRSGIPWIDQLGEIGRALGNTTRKSQRTELIIFIRPQIIRDAIDAAHVAEELRTKLRGKPGHTNELPKQPLPSAKPSATANPLRVRN